MDIDSSLDPALQRFQLKAEEYRARAREALAEANGATLDRVREQRQASADTWAGLASAEEARIVSRRARLVEGIK
ncbi:hypothetical protein LJR164_004500 [Phenylobacterium sp. LjRoot164]|uniref:hypothetical protein n=1 Tax=unclassified Phenylobacterium TaxID=2640670 RepID=UPI003ECE8156